jgi:hypothetical protein
MKSPTLEEVKEYFKNAKEVKCLWDGKIYNISSWKLYKDECGFRYAENKKAENERFCGVFGINDYAKFAEIISYKNTYTVSKDFILEAHESACSTWKTKIENQFPKLFPKVELEVWKWYKWKDTGDVFLYITNFDGDKVKGFGVDKTDWFDNRNNVNYWGYKNDKFWTLAAEEEVETALIAEAKRRGYKANIKITHDGLLNERGILITEGKRNISNSKFEYEENVLRQSGHIIYSNGKWAEIISEPIELSLEQIAEKFGVDVSQIKIKK